MLEIDKDGNRFLYNEKHQLHKVNGPACEYSNGVKHWCLNGRLHRLDGPAIEYLNGEKIWYLNGKSYTESEYIEKVRK